VLFEKKLSLKQRQAIIGNIQAGTTTAVLLIPQSMAYALVAGVEPVHGLYASLLPLLVYACLGKSRELALGPGALDTLLIGVAIGGLSLNYNSAAIAGLIAFQVALIQLLVGCLRGGFLINFLSKPVISGFTSAAALTIALSQVKHLLGIEMPNSALFFPDFWLTLSHLHAFHGMTALFGLGSVVFILVAKKINKKFPNALAAVIVASLLASLFSIDQQQVAVLGVVPKGLPVLGFPDLGLSNFLMTVFSLDLFMALLPNAFAIAAVGYLTSISISRTFADRNKYDIPANRELIALGAANFAASISQAFPVSGSFSRSAVHAEAGATSPYSLVVVVFWIVLTLSFLTDYLYYLPKATLSAIIITAVLGLMDFSIIKQLKKTKPYDMYLLLITFFSTLAIGIIEGILLGVILSLSLFIYRSTRPHTAVLGRLGDSPNFRNIENYPDAITYPGIIMIRIDAQFYFGNVTYLKAFLKQLEKQSSVAVNTIIVESCSINQLDSSADSALQDIHDEFKSRGINLKFSSVKVPVMKVMKASGLYQKVGAENFYMNLDDALLASLSNQ